MSLTFQLVKLRQKGHGGSGHHIVWPGPVLDSSTRATTKDKKDRKKKKLSDWDAIRTREDCSTRKCYVKVTLT